jgi:ribosomal protein L11 methyltransferase
MSSEGSPLSGVHTWKEMSLCTPPEMVEIVANFLLDEDSRGVVIEDITEKDPFWDRKHMGWLWVRAYYPPERIENLRQKLGVYLRELSRLFPQSEPPILDLRDLPQEDWAETWKQFFTPIQVTPYLLIRPSWDSTPVPKGVETIVLDPGMAFGTGKHPTTRLCIQALYEGIIQLQNGSPGSNFFNLLDVGTGSGIIAMCSARMGIPRVLGIDIDPVAIQTARKNVRLNNLERRVEISPEPLESITEKFDIVVANLVTEILLEIKRQLVARLNPRGYLIISGILKGQGSMVKREFLKEQLEFHSAYNDDDWCSLVFQRI